jgi:hypothetical protein
MALRQSPLSWLAATLLTVGARGTIKLAVHGSNLVESSLQSGGISEHSLVDSPVMFMDFDRLFYF